MTLKEGMQHGLDGVHLSKVPCGPPIITSHKEKLSPFTPKNFSALWFSWKCVGNQQTISGQDT